MTAHNILKAQGYTLNEGGAIKWLRSKNINLSSDKTSLIELYRAIHKTVCRMKKYNGNEYELDVLFSLLSDKKLKLDIEEILDNLKHDDDYIYYAENACEVSDSLPNGTTERFLEVESYDVLISKEELITRVALLEE